MIGPFSNDPQAPPVYPFPGGAFLRLRVDGLADQLGLSFSAFLDSMSDAELGRAIAAVKASIAGESIDAESEAMIEDLAVRMRARGAGPNGPLAMSKGTSQWKSPRSG